MKVTVRRQRPSPAEPDVGCDACFEGLDRYVELELAGEEVDAAIRGLRAHLDGCPACREEYESLRALVGGDRALWRPQSAAQKKSPAKQGFLEADEG